MSDTATSANDSVVLVNEFNYHQMLNSVRMPHSRGDFDTSTFGNRDMRNVSTMRGAVLNTEGFREGETSHYQNIVDAAVGNATNRNIILYGPNGDADGSQCFMLDSNQNSTEVGGNINQGIMISSVFNGTGGSRLGKVLHGCHDGVETYKPGYYKMLFNAVPGGTNLALRTRQSIVLSPFFTLNGLNAGAGINAGLKAALEAMPAFNGLTCTITGALVIGGGNWTGELHVSFNSTDTIGAPIVITDAGAQIVGSVAIGMGHSNMNYVTAGGNSGAIDNLVATAGGYTSHVHCVGKTGVLGSILTLKVQHSHDAAAWVDLFTFNTLNAAGKQRIVSGSPTAIVRRHVRALWTMATPGDGFAFTVALSRYGKVH